jgi:hypothetical protein
MDSEPQRKSRNRRPLILICIFVFIAGAVVIVPNYLRARGTACQNACINNLRQIDGAKEQWALAHDKKPGTPISKADELEINNYIKGGEPKCPGDGKYSYNDVGMAPTCSFARGKEAHSLTP